MFADTKWDAKKMVQSFARMGMVHGAKPEVTKSLKDGSIISYDLRPIPSSEWLNVASNEDDSATTTSVEMNDGVVLDSAREFRAKLYMGQVRSNNTKIYPKYRSRKCSHTDLFLICQVFMGWMWFIPCFHLEQPPSRDAPKTVITLTRSEVDFPLGFGALLVDVELTLGWDLDTMEEEAPRQPDRSASGHETEPHTQGVIAAMGGDVNALQASKD
jgi:phosphatidylinositol-3,4,5-trisphosphate 3-phosphatase/dual-specificity protein phosphatase PTEN